MTGPDTIGPMANPESSSTTGMVDLHAHLLPGVDDGARDLEEALDALQHFQDQGVAVATATPHFRASLLEDRARAQRRLDLFDAAWDMLLDGHAKRGLRLEVGRGVELRLDAPRVRLDDERLRLAGGPSVLVEFATFQVPPFGGNQLRRLIDDGWSPVLAHPERYGGIRRAIDRVGGWREAGVRLQMNAGSLTGRYGQRVRSAAVQLLSRGWVDCLSSDYHALGESDLAAVRTFLDEQDAGGGLADLLMRENPARVLAGRPLESVPPVDIEESGGLWRWMR